MNNLWELIYKYNVNQFYPDVISLRNENKYQIAGMISMEQ